MKNIVTKESANFKVLTLEKRLKNSETCPDQLSPSLPGTGDRLATRESTVFAPQSGVSKQDVRKNITVKSKESLDRQTAGGLRKQVSQNASFNGLVPASRQQTIRQTDALKSK